MEHTYGIEEAQERRDYYPDGSGPVTTHTVYDVYIDSAKDYEERFDTYGEAERYALATIEDLEDEERS